MTRETEIQDELQQLKELMGLIFNLYCECDHANWEKPLFKNKKMGEEIKSNITGLEDMLWTALTDLQNSFGLDVREEEVYFETLKISKFLGVLV